MSEWQPIETAPKDGTRILLARHGWLNHSDAEYGTEQWSKDIWDNAKRKYDLWWACTGFWSAKWKNWNDGMEPSGLSDPTHWMPTPPLPPLPT